MIENNTIILQRDPTSYERYNRMSAVTQALQRGCSVLTILFQPLFFTFLPATGETRGWRSQNP